MIQRDRLCTRHADLLRYLIRPIECGDGWNDLLHTMLQKLEEAPHGITIRQIKEKFGVLCCHTEETYYPADINVIIGGAIVKSRRTCEVCGGAERLRKDRPWIRTLCDEHAS